MFAKFLFYVMMFFRNSCEPEYDCNDLPRCYPSPPDLEGWQEWAQHCIPEGECANIDQCPHDGTVVVCND